MAHSDDLEEHKSIQTTSRKQISWTRIWYIGTLHRASKQKPFLVQPQISCNSTGLLYIVVASPLARHRYGDIGAHCLSQQKSMAPCDCIEVVDSSQEVWYPIRPASTSWNKSFRSSQPKNTFALSAGVSRPPPAPNKATEALILSVFPESSRAKGSSNSGCAILLLYMFK